MDSHEDDDFNLPTVPPVKIVTPVFVPEKVDNTVEEELEEEDVPKSWEELKGSRNKLLSQMLNKKGTGGGGKKELWELLGKRRK